MEIINGIETEVGPYIYAPNIQQWSETKTADYTLTVNDTGKTIIFNSTSNLTCTLFTPTAADVGKRFTFANINTGSLTIQVAGTGVQINNGTATTGNMSCGTDKTATLTLEVTSTTKWSVISANETWTTS